MTGQRIPRYITELIRAGKRNSATNLDNPRRRFNDKATFWSWDRLELGMGDAEITLYRGDGWGNREEAGAYYVAPDVFARTR